VPIDAVTAAELMSASVSILNGIKSLLDKLASHKELAALAKDFQQQAKDLQQQAEDVKQQAVLAEVEAYRKLGYEICRKHKPPVVMTRTDQGWWCDECEREYKRPLTANLHRKSRWQIG